MKTTKLITCDNLTEAHLIKGRLNNEGIECFLTNQNFTSLMPISDKRFTGIQVIVSESDLDKAKQIIEDKLNPDNA